MKPKQFVEQMKPFAQKVLELMNNSTEEAEKAYKDWCDQTDQLFNECSEVIQMRMKGYNPSKPGYFSSADGGTTRMVNAIREASVKYNQVYLLLCQELGVEELPFPMMKSALFMPTLISLQKAVDESEFTPTELRELYQQADGMAKSLLLQDDKIVKSILHYCNQAIAHKSPNLSQRVGGIEEFISKYVRVRGDGITSRG
jgi:hypothetical protein